MPKVTERPVPLPRVGGIDRGLDFHAWCHDQARAITERRFSDLHLAELAEELSDLGNERYRALESAYRVLIAHMLKWTHQRELRSRSWQTTIANQRLTILDILDENPSLRRRTGEAIERAYAKARNDAAGETGLPVRTFPAANPFSDADLTTTLYLLDDE